MQRTRIAINGLGRIGRCVLRALVEQDYQNDIEIVAVNGPADTKTHEHLLRYDSVHGRFSGALSSNDDMMSLESDNFPVFHERDPLKLPWGKLGVDIVLECTGVFNSSEKSAAHIEAGAKKVLLSAPAKDDTPTIIYGVNNKIIESDANIFSIGSCTTNCLAPIAKVLNDEFGIEAGFMTTIHAYTGDQNIVDSSHKDMRRARAAGLSMVPTSTGAAKTIGKVIPELNGKLDGTAVRVPTPNVSMIDLKFQSTKPVSNELINDTVNKAASTKMLSVIEVSELPLVSIDFTHSPASAIFDLTGTSAINENFARVAAWYDNEWGFSCRMLDVVKLVAVQNISLEKQGMTASC